jgi:hypothetical protein
MVIVPLLHWRGQVHVSGPDIVHPPLLTTHLLTPEVLVHAPSSKASVARRTSSEGKLELGCAGVISTEYSVPDGAVALNGGTVWLPDEDHCATLGQDWP